ncbi:3-deoxy-manno-octulosonate-8-phosphatase KdsC [Thalassotalea euphylliae]|uniref:3-deoxy-D-manno-octulosonate 8-phosphate phosphatase KdsC n=1 Tax=Thalassotalea euphylliae TaxID=1655234 RepID=A0A3E0TNH0_9GAMM|nr:3-deoxy-manno-octulosonate-8-phosphatase KdsC [Thalassotalea euphylliae]REL25652.1 3-deoxy-manno-octulosonate-8-phosphatase KdsC [Thalassotalea euphylliae]
MALTNETQTTGEQVTTFYGPVAERVMNSASDIKLLVCDVDGVFSDGRIYLGNQGEELKAFHTKDGYGVKALIASGVTVAIITGRNSRIVNDRMKALNISHIIQGKEDKLPEMQALMSELSISAEQVAYIGDDMADLPCIEYAALGVAVKDAHPAVLAKADYCTYTLGGFGAVRELCDLIMLSQNTLSSAKGASV